ncbi:hypothetical protein [Nonomuraea sp. NPDC003709]|uniref:hypothetical protein n=1 Tax=Nonomuraea sp. NPDC003709 TaxID=3154450 RepID=UPI0033B5FD9B
MPIFSSPTGGFRCAQPGCNHTQGGRDGRHRRDHRRESAALYFEDNTENTAVRDRRRILRDAMAGFRCDADEWWHFDYGNQIWAVHHKRPVALYGEIDDYG